MSIFYNTILQFGHDNLELYWARTLRINLIPDIRTEGGFQALLIAEYLILNLILYTLWILFVLTAVERPQAIALPDEEDHEGQNGLPAEQLESQSRQIKDRHFVTSGIWRTLRHLRQEAGPWSPWRGLGLTLCFYLLRTLYRSCFSIFLVMTLPHFSPTFDLDLLPTMCALCPFAVECTHAVIAAPQPNSRPRVSWNDAKKSLPALIFWTCFEIVIIQLTVLILANQYSTMICFVGIGVVILLAMVGVPILIILVRIQASLLPDDTMSIVPFDKTFGQDTSDTNGILTIKKAAKSIDYCVIKRVFLLLFKCVLCVSLTVGLLFAIDLGLAKISSAGGD